MTASPMTTLDLAAASEGDQLVLRLRAAIRAELDRAGVAHDVVTLAAHPAAEFRIRPCASDGPRVSVFAEQSWSIFADGFLLVVRDYAPDEDEWIEECRQVVALLVRSNLRIRVRRPLFGVIGRPSGAVWLPWAEGGGLVGRQGSRGRSG